MDHYAVGGIHFSKNKMNQPRDSDTRSGTLHPNQLAVHITTSLAFPPIPLGRLSDTQFQSPRFWGRNLGVPNRRNHSSRYGNYGGNHCVAGFTKAHFGAG